MSFIFDRVFNEYNLPYDKDKIPDNCAGLYLFLLRFPTNYELGVNNLDNNKIKDKLISKLSLYHKLFYGFYAHGSISDYKYSHLETSYETKIKYTGFDCVNTLLDGIFDKITNVNLIDMISIIRESVSKTAPLYIGITEKQTLQDRILQHLNGQTQLQERLYDSGLQWFDLKVSCTCVSDDSKLRQLEKILQNMFKPIFSLR
jgi:hypothetical protein